MAYFTYILQSMKDKRYYIGSTSNIDRRLSEHNAGKTKSLRHRKPLVLVQYEEYDIREEAELREKQIKSYKGGKAFKELIQGSSPRL